jgi:hypothetical protein
MASISKMIVHARLNSFKGALLKGWDCLAESTEKHKKGESHV